MSPRSADVRHSSSRFAATVWPEGFRAYQSETLAQVDAVFAAGRSRCWAVLPPGAGKTLVGLESARRLGRRIVVLVPNTAIQGQWVRTWQRFAASDQDPANGTVPLLEVGTERDLRHPVTVLTYQSLAVFDDEHGGRGVKSTGPLLEQLHENGRALVAAMHSVGPLTIVLDECHHLLEVWGRLVVELLDELDDAAVLGLTATPPETLTHTQAQLVERLFGAPLRGASLPAVVRQGYLAPFAELAFLTPPTPVEADYIRGQAERFVEFRSGLMDPEFASTGFLAWCDTRFIERAAATGGEVAVEAGTVPWSRLEQQEPALAAAALRMHHVGLLSLPPGSRVREEHRREPSAEDWVTLLDDYVGNCLSRSADPQDAAAVAAIRAALPSIGYRLTTNGVRAASSPVDRVLARSDAKTHSTIEILAVEAGELGPALRALILCDFESATATVSASLADVLKPETGGAVHVLRQLVEDERTADLAPILVTGRTVAAAPETAAAFARWAHEQDSALALDVELRDGLAHLRGAWSSRTWVALATRFFEAGHTRVLVGTRALLGEGWDAHGVNVVVDLTTATTTGSVVQMRGRGLRLDPSWPEKVTNNWTVVCVAEGHPKGAADWHRFVRKHEGHLAVRAAGEIVSGIGHVDPAFSPYGPPESAVFDASNVAMLLRAGQRVDTRRDWSIGEPYTDELVHTIRVTARRAPLRTTTGETIPVRRALPGPSGAALSGRSRMLLWLTPGRAARLLAEAAGEPPIASLGGAVADALKQCGISPVGAEALDAVVEPSGTYRLQLSGVDPATSLAFVQALDELAGPIAEPRWLMPRYHLASLPAAGRERRAVVRAWLLGSAPGNAVVYHAVPAVFARSARRVEAFTAAWNRHICAGRPVAASSPEGEGILVTHRGASPLEATTALRVAWS
ncbi:DEAD/DEAH box helicase family protein [Actinospica robiniae]|uniref:DEAD/DEAH box helicase family protein n=1 Tax=Actinospica robiniae TaxID=304901 RepID=UPI0004023332|nr:DEAD/DEAH box helicase family protein [Actinospica robiniae]